MLLLVLVLVAAALGSPLALGISAPAGPCSAADVPRKARAPSIQDNQAPSTNKTISAILPSEDLDVFLLKLNDGSDENLDNKIFSSEYIWLPQHYSPPYEEIMKNKESKEGGSLKDEIKGHKKLHVTHEVSHVEFEINEHVRDEDILTKPANRINPGKSLNSMSLSPVFKPRISVNGKALPASGQKFLDGNAFSTVPEPDSEISMSEARYKVVSSYSSTSVSSPSSVNFFNDTLVQKRNIAHGFEATSTETSIDPYEQVRLQQMTDSELSDVDDGPSHYGEVATVPSLPDTTTDVPDTTTDVSGSLTDNITDVSDSVLDTTTGVSGSVADYLAVLAPEEDSQVTTTILPEIETGFQYYKPHNKTFKREIIRENSMYFKDESTPSYVDSRESRSDHVKPKRLHRKARIYIERSDVSSFIHMEPQKNSKMKSPADNTKDTIPGLSPLNRALDTVNYEEVSVRNSSVRQANATSGQPMALEDSLAQPPNVPPYVEIVDGVPMIISNLSGYGGTVSNFSGHVETVSNLSGYPGTVSDVSGTGGSFSNLSIYGLAGQSASLTELTAVELPLNARRLDSSLTANKQVSRSRLPPAPRPLAPAPRPAPSYIAALVSGLLTATLLVTGAALFLLHRRALPRPKAFGGSYAGSDYDDASGHSSYTNSQPDINRGCADDLISLDNDSFLNSLESMTIQNVWTDSVKHTKL